MYVRMKPLVPIAYACERFGESRESERLHSKTVNGIFRQHHPGCMGCRKISVWIKKGYIPEHVIVKQAELKRLLIDLDKFEDWISTDTFFLKRHALKEWPLGPFFRASPNTSGKIRELFK